MRLRPPPPEPEAYLVGFLIAAVVALSMTKFSLIVVTALTIITAAFLSEEM